MQQCPKCKNTFMPQVFDNNRHYSDEVTQEIALRQATSDLCADCLLEEWVAEIGAANLKRLNLASADDRER